jgi:hypothetical protein
MNMHYSMLLNKRMENHKVEQCIQKHDYEYFNAHCQSIIFSYDSFEIYYFSVEVFIFSI